ncbi:carboxypeptidase-like regulatory domain-containing protein [Bacteroidales bacterium OttesenSCG-928-J16]|nr:carboxypeptidase-like regulatory domain-containing protein [Bacteroidales bacterium OttesenSCG-928-J16]
MRQRRNIIQSSGRILTLSCLFLLSSASVFSQIRVEGFARDGKTSEVIEYASVYLQGSNTGTITNRDGKFSIYIADTAKYRTLSFSCIGYEKTTRSLKELTVNPVILLEPAVVSLEAVEIRHISSEKLAALLAEIIKKYRQESEPLRSKIFLSLQTTENSTIPLESIEAFYSGLLTKRDGFQEMDLKSGRIAINTNEALFFNLNNTDLLCSYSLFGKKRTLDFPDSPFQGNPSRILNNFILSDNGLVWDGDIPCREIAFQSKRENGCRGVIVVSETFKTVKSVEITYNDLKTSFFSPLNPADSFSSLNLRFAYYFKQNEKKPEQMILERAHLDSDFTYYSSSSDRSRDIDYQMFLLCYDYDNLFEKTIFNNQSLLNDYLKITSIPLNPRFWEINYFLADNEEHQKKLAFFAKNGILINHSQEVFKRNDFLQTPYLTWSPDYQLEKNDFENLYRMQLDGSGYVNTGSGVSFISRSGLSAGSGSGLYASPYNINAQIFLDYFDYQGAIEFSTKTLFDKHTSYWLIEWDDLKKEFVNIYFGLYEMVRRKIEARLKALSGYDEKAILSVYQEEMENLKRKSKEFSSQTNFGRSKTGLEKWQKTMNEELLSDVVVSSSESSYTELFVENRQVVYQANKDNLEFYESSKIVIPQLSQAQIGYLDLLGKTWGVMKYHHPEIAAGAYNWDFELFRIMPDVLQATSPQQCQEILYQWILDYGKLPGEEETADKEDIKMHPDFEWITDLSHEALISTLKQLQNCKKSVSHYYIDFDKNIGKPIFKNESDYGHIVYPDAGFRLLSLFRYWNIIQYFFPYRYAIGADWNQMLQEFIPQFVEATDAAHYQLTVLKLITRVNDTHAVLSPAGIALDTLRGIYHAPVSLTFIENEPVVSNFVNEKLAFESGLKIGDVIKKIDGETIGEIIHEEKNIAPASNESTRLQVIASDLLRSQTGLLEIEFERQGVIKTEKITCYTSPTLFASFVKKQKPPYQLLDDDIGYINIGTLMATDIDALALLFKNTKGIIVDLRSYPIYAPGQALGEYLLPERKDFALLTSGNVNVPGQFSYFKTAQAGTKTPNHYKGKTVILVNEKTQSAAEYHAMLLQTVPDAVVVGSTTAAADGDVSKIVLPGGIQTQISGVGVYYPDKSETQRIGILPDIKAKPTITGFREGRDEVMEKAIEVIKTN